MTDSKHWDECWRMHYPCALLRIWDLEKEVQTLKTQLQVERTGHLTPQEAVDTLTREAQQMGMYGVPCHDHIEPPIVSQGPTWAARNDEPPSFTP